MYVICMYSQYRIWIRSRILFPEFFRIRSRIRISTLRIRIRIRIEIFRLRRSLFHDIISSKFLITNNNFSHNFLITFLNRHEVKSVYFQNQITHKG